MEKDNLTPSEKLNKLKEVLFAHRKADKDEGEKEIVAQGGSNKNPEIQDGPKQELEAGEKKLISEDSVSAAAKVPFKKEYHQGNYTGAAKHIEKKYGSKVLNHPKVKDALRQANESKMATKDHDGDGKVETSTAEYKGSKDKAIKNALAKRKDENEKAMKTGFMKMPEYARKKFDESSWDGGDPSDAPSKADLEKERSARLKKMNMKKAKKSELKNAERTIAGLEEKKDIHKKKMKGVKANTELKNAERTISGMEESSASWKATQEAEKMARLSKGEQQKISQIRSMLDKEKKAKQNEEMIKPGEYIGTSGVKMSKYKIKGKFGKPQPITGKPKSVNKNKEKYPGLQGEENIQEISADLINKVRTKRKIQHGKEYMDNYGHVSKETQRKMDRNTDLTFRAGARAAHKLGKQLSGHMNNWKKSMKNEENIQEISDKMKVNYIKKAKEQITDREKHGTSSVDKDQILKRRIGIRTATGKLGEENIQEISQDLATKVTKQRKINVGSAAMDANGDHRDPDYAKAKQKLRRNQSLRFSRGARKISKAFDGKRLGEATERLQEISDALKKRYIAKANKQITSKEKMKDYQLGQMDKQKDNPKSLPREKFTKADKEFVKNKYDKEINKRRVGVRQARSKLGEENIQEISKDLASRYIKRAVGSAISNADKTQYHTSKMFQKQDKGDYKGAKKEYKAGRDPSRKTMNRFYGIQRAAGKLNKNDKNKGEYLGHSMTKSKTSSKIKAEEKLNELKALTKTYKDLKPHQQKKIVKLRKQGEKTGDYKPFKSYGQKHGVIAAEEMIKELRKSTLSNYIKKAGKQYDDGENALHKGYPEKPIYKMQDKRAKGMAMAGKKLAKNEELQMRLDELKRRLDPKCWDGYKKQGTKKKGDTIVNNCVKESSAAKAAADARRDMKRDSKGLASTKQDKQKKYDPSKDKSPPHIISQLQKAVSLGDKHDGVKFKDGKTHKVSAKHAQGFINKYMSSKPADKEKMQSHGHESHKNFKTHL